MEAGRELDALVAEKVMEWEPCPCSHNAAQPFPNHFIHGDDYIAECPHYSTDIAAVWQVEERIEELHLIEQYVHALKQIVTHMSSDQVIVRDGRGWYDDVEFRFIHARPKERCLAALKALGVEVPG